MQNKYKNQDNKLKKLSGKQITTHASNEIIKYFPRVINKMDIVFSNKEYTTISKGLKYNLNWTKLRGLSPRANYTDRVAAAGRRR